MQLYRLPQVQQVLVVPGPPHLPHSSVGSKLARTCACAATMTAQRHVGVVCHCAPLVQHPGTPGL